MINCVQKKTSDAAGVVESVGSAVKNFKVGDEVFYAAELFPQISKGGTYAEFHIVNEEIVAKKPKNVSFVEAACLPLAGITAWDCVVDKAKVKIGETVFE